MSRKLPSYRVQAAAVRVMSNVNHLGAPEGMHALLCVVVTLLLAAEGDARVALAQMMTEGIQDGMIQARQLNMLLGPSVGHG